jgi:[pyruvate, water dikinase]-phosphate phosphotransferase / [pyruvate, water dikinase] kinase
MLRMTVWYAGYYRKAFFATQNPQMYTVFVVSDATGRTAERLVRAALEQFAGAAVQVVRRTQVRSVEQVCSVVREAAAAQALIVHTLVEDDLRRRILAESRQQGVDALDSMGPLLERLAGRLKLAPQQKPGLLRQLEDAKLREIEAVAFAFRHDDGLNANELDRAEVVLVGVSRSMKTPTMLYLAYRGWFAANVPLIPELPPLEPLLCVPPQRIICLTMAADKLSQLRRTRAVNDGIEVESYASAERVRKELDYAGQLCKMHGWRQIDVTNKSVEEAAREIIVLLSGCK